MRRGIGTAGLAALVVLVVAPTSASAAVSCSYDGGTESLSIAMSSAGDAVHLAVSGAAIQVRNQSFNLVSCSGGSPTTANTDAIGVTDGSGGSTTVHVDDPDSFNGGPSESPLNDAEIEIDIAMGSGARDELQLRGPSFANARFVYGTEGISTSAASEATPDVDITLTGVERNTANGVFGDDVLSGAGGSGTGGAFIHRLKFDGSFGDDELTGGAASDTLTGSFDADEIRGGPNRDTARYPYICKSGCDVRVTIGRGTGDDGAPDDESGSSPGTRDTVKGNVEKVTAGNGNDKLVGNGKDNLLTGGTGRDKLIGRGGNDFLKAKDFVQDLRLDCGPGKNDKVRRDRFDPTPKSC